eukprot:scaffold3.g6609.t1
MEHAQKPAEESEGNEQEVPLAEVAARAEAAQTGAHPAAWTTPVWKFWEDPTIASLGLVCPGCLMADSVGRMDGRYGAPCCSALSWGFLLPILSCALVGSSNRRLLRKQLNLPGSACSDYALHTLLPWCAVCQEAREIKYRSELQVIQRPSNKLLSPDTEAPQIQLMHEESQPRGLLIRRWNKGGSPDGGGSAGARKSPAAPARAARPVPKAARSPAAAAVAAGDVAKPGAASPPQQQAPQQAPQLEEAQATAAARSDTLADAVVAAVESKQQEVGEEAAESAVEHMLRTQTRMVRRTVAAAQAIRQQAEQAEEQLQHGNAGELQRR